MNADQNEGWYDENRPDLTRRRFLQALGATSAATLMGSAPLRGEKVEQPKATADACILIWMAGGMAAPETFDPKRYFPFEVGTPVDLKGVVYGKSVDCGGRRIINKKRNA